jgi:UPF0755 protein
MAKQMYRGRRKRADGPARWPLFWALVALLVVAPLLWLYLDPTPSASGAAPATIVVQPGDGWREVTERLREAGVVRRPLVFQGLVLLSGRRGDLMPGRYQVRPGAGARDVINALTSEEGQARITVPEGWRVEQIGERMVERGLATPQEWRAALEDPPDIPLLRARPPGAGLNGYLYPDTYRFTEGDAARQFVRLATQNLEERLTPALRDGFRRQDLSVHEALTLASIVEREARLDAERPVIASVFLNRLEADMRLQADPTTQYAVGQQGEWWKRRLTGDDLRDPSPYNTYTNRGLPPGPIASPGIASIEAVARPAQTEYLYFVARGDGGHAFARTLDEHNENVSRYLGR